MVKKTFFLLGLLVFLAANLWTVESKDDEELEFLEAKGVAFPHNETVYNGKPRISFVWLKWEGEIVYVPDEPTQREQYYAFTVAVTDYKLNEYRSGCWHTWILDYGTKDVIPRRFRYSCWEDGNVHDSSYLGLEAWMNKRKWDHPPSVHSIDKFLDPCDYDYDHPYFYNSTSDEIPTKIRLTMLLYKWNQCGYE